MNVRRHPLAAAIIAVAVTPISVTAIADDETILKPVKVQEKGIKEEYLPVVSSVGAKTPTLIRDIPQTVNIVNRAVLDSQQATSLKDALRYVPGITFSAGEGGTIGDNINLRGFSARTDTYIDGFRDRGQYTRDTFYLDAVEVLKGPSSMLFGRGSTGGVINQSSKKPDLKARGEVSMSLGTDDYYRTVIDVNQPVADDAAVRIAAFAQDVQTTRDVVHNKDFGVAPSLRFGIGSDTEFNFSALIQRNNDIPDYGFPLLRSDRTANSIAKPAAAPAHNFYGYLDDHFDQNVDVFTAGVKHVFNSNVTLNSRVQYSQYRVVASPSPLGSSAIIRASGIAAVPVSSTPLDSINAQRQDRDRTIDDSSLFAQTDLVAKIKTAGIQHTLTTGFEFGLDRYRNHRRSYPTGFTNFTINLGDPDNGNRPEAGRFLLSKTQTDADTAAAYINDQIDLNAQWKVVAGVRWDRYSADANVINYNTAGSGAVASAVPSSRTDTMPSVRAGVIWQPNDDQSYYISYGTSFNPSAETVTLSASQENISPEKNRSYEIGAKFDLLEGNLQLNSAVFRIEKTDARTTDPLTSEVTLNGDIRVDGFEASAVGFITSDWQILAGYTYLDGEIVDGKERTALATAAGDVFVYSEGKALQNTPKNTVTLWTTYTLFNALEIGGGAVYLSDRYVNNFETAQIDGYTRWDATVAWRQSKYDIRLNVQNLTDKKYFEVASGGRATPANGRTAIVTGTYRF